MLLTSLFSLALAAVAAAGGEYCHQSPYNSILAFQGYGPAQSYCSKTYPVAPNTRTSCHWVTKTWWYTHTPSTTTTTTTSTTTTVDLVDKPIENRREAAATANNWAQCSSKLKGQGKLGLACSCIETTSTTTTMTTSTTSTTSTITAPTTTTSTETSTSIITITILPSARK